MSGFSVVAARGKWWWHCNHCGHSGRRFTFKEKSSHEMVKLMRAHERRCRLRIWEKEQ